jgi:membrane protease YdiL (CAAX protease family)
MIAEALGLYNRLVIEKENSDQLIHNLIQPKHGYYFGIFTIGIVTGIAEEFAFRAFLFHHLIKHTKRIWISILLSSFLFAILHFNFLQIIPLFLFGIILAIVYFVTNKLWIPILLHSTNNILNVYWMRTNTFPDWMENIQLEIIIPSTLLLMGLLYYYRKKLV